ncbi:MAG: FAD-binding oxidoreductase, partial [bacterium]
MENVAPSKLDESHVGSLREIFGADGVSVRDTDRSAYSRDLWPLATIWLQKKKITPYPPDAVVWARGEEQIVRLLALARENGFAVIPYGAGSGVCGGTLPLRGGVVLDMKKMDVIVDVNGAALTARVQTGIIGQDHEHE